MNICGQNPAVSNMCRRAENALKGHTVSELSNQPSKHSRQLTSSASFLTKVQATTEPHTLFQQREKGSRLRPAKETHNHEKQICTNEHHRNTQTRIQLSLNQTFQSPEVPAKWWVPHRAVTVKHKKNKRLHVTARDVGKRKNSHTENNPSTQCATMLNNLARRRRHNNLRVTDAKDLINTHRTHCRSRMRTHTCTTRHATPKLKTTCGHTTKHATHGTPWNQNDVDITSSPRRFSKLGH